MKITKDLLQKLKACKDGIQSFKNIDLDKIYVKENSFIYDYFAWLKNELKFERKYDKNKNCLYKKYLNGNEWFYEYDEK